MALVAAPTGAFGLRKAGVSIKVRAVQSSLRQPISKCQLMSVRSTAFASALTRQWRCADALGPRASSVDEPPRDHPGIAPGWPDL